MRNGKYNNTIVKYVGKTFHSKMEMERYQQLEQLEKYEVIRDLECQVKIPLYVNGQHVCTYIADFVYWDNEKNREVVEDVKGMRTPEYRLKKKLLKACHNIDIYETGKKK